MLGDENAFTGEAIRVASKQIRYVFQRLRTGVEGLT
jgi:hypothetical protein